MAPKTKKPRKLPAFTWNPERIEFLLQMVIEQQLLNGRDQKIKWGNITPRFDVAMNVKCHDDSLVNKYKALKREYSAWMDLKKLQTGLGWNDAKGTIEASNEWWTEKNKVSIRHRS